MTHMHVAATEEYRNRVIQPGENPKVVMNVGALGVEDISNTKPIDKED